MTADNSPSYRIEEARNGCPNLVLKTGSGELVIHSRVNPSAEAERFADKYNPEKYDFLVVLGAGLGYHLIPLKSLLGRYRKIIIIDLLPDIRSVISLNSQADFISSSSSIELLGGCSLEELSQILEELIDLDGIKGISVVEHPQSLRAAPQYYEAAADIIKRIVDSRGSNAATIKKFSTRFLINIVTNLGSIDRFRAVSSLKNCFNNHNAAVVCPGPSLDGYIDSLVKMKDSIYIIATDSAFLPLRARGICPDMIVSIDPQPYVEEHLTGEIPAHVIRVFSISSYWKPAREHGGFLSLNTHPLSQIIQKFSRDDPGSVDSRTGSVAGDALSLAILCGFSRIFLFGYDFSFTGFNTYSRGTAYQLRNGVYLNDRFSTAETRNLNYIMGASRAFRKENKFTRRAFLHYRENLETFLAGQDHQGIFHIRGDGLPLKGAVDAGLDELFTTTTGDEKLAYVKKLMSDTLPLGEHFSLPILKELLNDSVFAREAAAESGCGSREEKFFKIISLLPTF